MERVLEITGDDTHFYGYNTNMSSADNLFDLPEEFRPILPHG